jgi:hypothetical protein
MTTISMTTRPAFAPCTRTRRLLSLAAAVSFGLAAMQAQAAGMGDAPGHHGMGAQCGHQMMDKDMGAMRSAHLAAIKKQLHLTPEQDAAWNQWQESTKPMDGMGHPDIKKADWAALTTPQRLDKMRAMHEEHSQRMAQAMARHTEATKTFYAALTEAQQKTFDEVTLKHMVGGARRGH